MSCARLAFLLSFVAAAVARGVAAESVATGAKNPVANEPPAIFSSSVDFTPGKEAAPNPIKGPAVLEKPRVVSPTIAAQLSAVAPKFDASLVPMDKPVEPGVDLREIDKPRNTIVRLPKYIVREEKTPVLKDREIRTPKASLELALKKFPGLRLGSFWIFRNDGIALAMLREEERLEQKREFEDLAGLMRITDPAAGAAAKHQVQQAFLREADFGR